MTTDAARITMIAKSRWHPSVRREHSLAFALLEAGHEVHFVERARDIRDLRRRLTAVVPAPSMEGLVVHSPFTPVPAHHSRLAHAIETRTLERHLGRIHREQEPHALVVNAPWNWRAAVRAARGTDIRIVADLGDDWATLMPHRSDRIHAMYDEMTARADGIVVVNPGLGGLFGRETVVVPNAVAPEVLATAPVGPPQTRTMAYVGTFSERFDVGFVERVLDRLPSWSLQLYGPCRYASSRDAPSRELMSLIQRPQVDWHGEVSRRDLAATLDGADVLLLPNRPDLAEGQDPMKLYDYAARGRPIVATAMRVPDDAPAGLVRTNDPAEFAAAVESASGEIVTANRLWSERNTWASRLPLWLDTVVGTR